MTNHQGKIWERLINHAIIKHLEDNNLLSDRQHGFRPKRGAFSNLTQLWEHVIQLIDDEGALVELWSFDLTKAFDLLNHEKVLELCHKCGITGEIGQVIQNWLTDRTQFIECGNKKSQTVRVNKSCIQGSVLGPTLWLIYIQSLMDRLQGECEFFAYADDIAIAMKIVTKERLLLAATKSCL